MPTPRLLILTASFGDGHNSAARGLAGALQRESKGAARVEVRDFIREAQPLTARALEKLYALIITHAPWIWRRFYHASGPLPLEEDPVWALQPVRQALAADLRRDPPAAIICTFPLYPHLLQRLLGRSHIPVYTVVTDSISIHPIWKCESVRAYFAADEVSAGILRSWSPGSSSVIDAGFPVSPVFADLPSAPAGDTPRRVLFFPVSGRRVCAASLRSLLGEGPSPLDLTLVLGRHHRRLGSLVSAVAAEFPRHSVSVLGWTDEVPRLMTTHDLVIAKAGGATTHETAAAGRPALIVKVVPGQEEGNVELIERRGSGLLEEDPCALGPLLRQCLESGEWLRLRDAAWRHRRPAGAMVIARYLLNQVPAASPRLFHPPSAPAIP